MRALQAKRIQGGRSHDVEKRLVGSKGEVESEKTAIAVWRADVVS
jgi:hypothetical protein